jgi:AraC-like DNA-binding protein
MADMLDQLLAKIDSEEESRIELQPGAFYWRSSGTAAADGVSYDALIPAGIHVGAGNGRMASTIGGTEIVFDSAAFTRFRLAEPAACTTRLEGGRAWTSLGLWIEPGSTLGGELALNLQPLPNPCPAPPRILAMIGGAMTGQYRGAARGFALRAEAYALLAAACAATEAPWRPIDLRRKDAAEAARQILTAEYADPPSLAELARRVGVNRRYLSGDFRARFGRSIAAEIASLRLDHAEAMLRKWLPVGEVALRVGYSPSHFALAYRRRFGHPPSRHSR